jgi:hypothetical protein
MAHPPPPPPVPLTDLAAKKLLLNVYFLAVATAISEGTVRRHEELHKELNFGGQGAFTAVAAEVTCTQISSLVHL